MKRAVAYLEPFMEAEKDGGTRTQATVVLATVKGDVHDIGKNIVGVVLGCNNYEVVDLGVMVSAEKILDTALEKNASVVGLSGLITPSLDEMVHVAQEMERRAIVLPLLIGGATTSKQHTAVRIAPAYTQPTVHVLDASRVVATVASLLDPGRVGEFDQENRELQERLRAQHAERVRKPLLPIAAARANPQRVSFTDLPAPPFTGMRIVEPDLESLTRFVDWQFFFHAWELKGKFPAILDRPEAKELYDDALALLEEITVAGSLRPRGVYGFWPARSDGDDVVLEDGTRFCFLRQQSDYGDSRPNRCLADYVAPHGDALGAFAVGIHGAGDAVGALRGRARRLPLDHGQGARRPARGGFCRMAARRGQEGVVCARTRRSRARSWSASATGGSGPRSATRRVPTTARRRSSSRCSVPRTPGSS